MTLPSRLDCRRTDRGSVKLFHGPPTTKPLIASMKPFCDPPEGALKPTLAINRAGSTKERAMNAIVASVLMREAAMAQVDANPFKVAALICCAGLLTSLSIGAGSFEIVANFF
jgi:hypothetical protein